MNPLFFKYDISIRLANCLDRGNITTIEQLRDKTPWDLWNIKGIGEKTFNEIKKLLKLLDGEILDILKAQKPKRPKKSDILKAQKPKRPKKGEALFYKTIKRNLYIYRERTLVKRTLADIAEETGLTIERIRQITFNIKKRKYKNL